MQSPIKFLGVILYEIVSWKANITAVENKLSKNTGLLYCAKQVLDKTSFKKFMYIFFLYSFLPELWQQCLAKY